MNARQRRKLTKEKLKWFRAHDVLENEELFAELAATYAEHRSKWGWGPDHFPFSHTVDIQDAAAKSPPYRVDIHAQQQGEEGFVIWIREPGCGSILIGLLKSPKRKAAELEKNLLESLPRGTAPARRSAL